MEILNSAFKESRIIITNDKDFGNLVFKQKLKSKGIILLRLHDQSSKAKIVAIENLLDNYLNKLSNNFVVVSPSGIRIRKLY